MNPATRKFYGRLYALIYVAPGYLAAVVIYGLLFLRQAARSPEPPWGFTADGQAWSISATVLWALAIAGLAELLARIGYQLFNLQRRVITPDQQQAGLLTDALKPVGNSEDSWTRSELVPKLVELGPVPMLAVQEHRGGQLWISTYTLTTTATASLKQLILHERAHLALRSGLQEWLLRAILWALSWPAVQLLWPNPYWIAAAAAAHVSLWSWVNYSIRMRHERAADRMAAATVGTAEYAQHLGDYLEQFEPQGRDNLRRLRLNPLKTKRDKHTNVSEDE